MKNEKIVSVKETCAILNCSLSSIYRWEKDGILPFKKVKIGRFKVGYLLSDVLDYIDCKSEVEVSV